MRAEEIEALRRVGFGPNDYYVVGFWGEVEGGKSAALVCDECGDLGRIPAQEEGGWATVLETLAGDHVRQMAVREGTRHVVRIKFVVYCD